MADKRYTKPDNADEVLKRLKKKTKTKIIYPKEEMLLANKETPVYFKTDHHWTKKGAYIGYYELAKEIKKDFPNMPILEESAMTKYYDNRVSAAWNHNFNNGKTFKHMHLPKSYAKDILDTPYLYYKNPNKKDLKYGSELLIPILKKGYIPTQDNQFIYPRGLDKKALVIGDSFTGNLMEFLPYSFKYTIVYDDNQRFLKIKTYKSTIKKYKPDILVINLYTTNTKRLLNLFPNEFARKEGK